MSWLVKKKREEPKPEIAYKSIDEIKFYIKDQLGLKCKKAIESVNILEHWEADYIPCIGTLTYAITVSTSHIERLLPEISQEATGDGFICSLPEWKYVEPIKTHRVIDASSISVCTDLSDFDPVISDLAYSINHHEELEAERRARAEAEARRQRVNKINASKIQLVAYQCPNCGSAVDPFSPTPTCKFCGTPFKLEPENA